MKSESSNHTKNLNIILMCGIIILIIILGAIFVFSKMNDKEYEDYAEDKKYEGYATVEGVVVKVYDRTITVMGLEGKNSLYDVGFGEEGNIGFEKGQEVIIYYGGSIMESYPAQLGDVKKIKITKKKSDIEIPDSIIRFCYTSWGEVEVVVAELTNTGIALVIRDTNEMPYEYSHKYSISKQVPYTGNAVYHYSPGTGPIDPKAAALDRKKSRV